MKYQFPLNYGERCFLLPVDVTIAPFISGALNKFLTEAVWETRADYEQGYNAFAEVLSAMGNQCLEELVAGQDRLFMLWDSWINGTQYAELAGGISPPLPRVPASNTTAANSARAQLARLRQLAENAQTGAEFDAASTMEGTVPLDFDGSWTARLLRLQGEVPAGWFNLDTRPVQLLDLLKAGRVNNADDKSKIGQAIDEVDAALDVGTDLGNFIKGFLTSAAELGTDGGLIAVQLAVGAAQARLAQRMIKALDGGELLGPGGPGNNLLLHARKASMDDAGELNAGQALADIKAKLDDLADRVRGPSDGNGSVVSAIERLRLQLSALADLDSEDNPVTGTVLAGISDLLACICEGVNGTPSGPTTFPDPAQPCGSSYPTWVLRAEASLEPSGIPGDNVYRGAVESWQVVDSTASISWLSTPEHPALFVVGGSGPRELCVSYQLPTGASDPGPLSLNINPIIIDNGGPAGRPVVQTNGAASGTYEFWPDAAGGEPIGYDVQIAGPDNVPVSVPVRVNIHAGALG